MRMMPIKPLRKKIYNGRKFFAFLMDQWSKNSKKKIKKLKDFTILTR
jgi:hypothetical protein